MVGILENLRVMKVELDTPVFEPPASLISTIISSLSVWSAFLRASNRLARFRSFVKEPTVFSDTCSTLSNILFLKWYSATKLVNYGEKNYIKWAKDNYDWERIEKTKGRVISGIDRDEYISSVFELNTNSKNKLQESNEYLSNVGCN
jgi:hypothetical protein